MVSLLYAYRGADTNARYLKKVITASKIITRGLTLFGLKYGFATYESRHINEIIKDEQSASEFFNSLGAAEAVMPSFNRLINGLDYVLFPVTGTFKGCKNRASKEMWGVPSNIALAYTPVAFLELKETPYLERITKDITKFYESIGMELVYRED